MHVDEKHVTIVVGVCEKATKVPREVLNRITESAYYYLFLPTNCGTVYVLEPVVLL